MKKDEFYIGYLNGAPKSYLGNIRLFAIVAGIALLGVSVLGVMSQVGFLNSTFQLGNLSEHKGILTTDPVPMLLIPIGKNHEGKEVYNRILLIGFGKMGAGPTIQMMEKQHGSSLENKMVTLEGTLVYYDGKTLLELTKKEGALKEVGEDYEIKPDRMTYGEAVLRGEIMDSKCFFGVMKPAEGKPHRSCAIRCLSGNIPAVLRSTNNAGEMNYFIVLGADGELINNTLLDKVGVAVSISGKVEKVDDWFILKTQPSSIEEISPYLIGALPMCNELLSLKD